MTHRDANAPSHSTLAVLLGLMMLLACCGALRAQERIPPAPRQYFNDYAKVVPPAVAAQLDARLEQFERESSNQIVVAIFPTMESNSSVEDYTVRVAQAWKVGRKGKDNGAVLFVFIKERQTRLVTGYGLEGALPDAICKRIVDDEINARFKQGDFAGGLTAGVNAIIAATRGEYQGTGGTVARPQPTGQPGSPPPWAVVAFLVFFTLLMWWLSRASGVVYGSSGSRSYGSWGGGFGGGGGGGFSGGGGSFGGGGAGGKW